MNKVYLKDFERYIDEDVLIGKIATYIFVNTTTNTNYGSWCTDSEELGEVFPEEFVKEHEKDIVDTLLTNFAELVSDVETYYEDDRLVFDTNLYSVGVGGFYEQDPCFENDSYGMEVIK